MATERSAGVGKPARIRTFSSPSSSHPGVRAVKPSSISRTTSRGSLISFFKIYIPYAALASGGDSKIGVLYPLVVRQRLRGAFGHDPASREHRHGTRRPAPGVHPVRPKARPCRDG